MDAVLADVSNLAVIDAVFVHIPGTVVWSMAALLVVLLIRFLRSQSGQ